MKIYVGHLSFEVTEAELRQEFEAFGEVTSVDIITDKYSGRPKGFGFVEMASKSEAEAAITDLNGKEQILKFNIKSPGDSLDGSHPRFISGKFQVLYRRQGKIRGLRQGSLTEAFRIS